MDGHLSLYDSQVLKKDIMSRVKMHTRYTLPLPVDFCTIEPVLPSAASLKPALAKFPVSHAVEHFCKLVAENGPAQCRGISVHS